MADLHTEIQRLIELSGKATPGKWSADPKRLVINGVEGPIMSYLVGDGTKPEGMKVSLGSERLADHHLVAALVNFFRSSAPALLEAERDAGRWRYGAEHGFPQMAARESTGFNQTHWTYKGYWFESADTAIDSKLGEEPKVSLTRRCSCGWPDASCSRTQTDCAAWKP